MTTSKLDDYRELRTRIRTARFPDASLTYALLVKTGLSKGGDEDELLWDDESEHLTASMDRAVEFLGKIAPEWHPDQLTWSETGACAFSIRKDRNSDEIQIFASGNGGSPVYAIIDAALGVLIRNEERVARTESR